MTTAVLERPIQTIASPPSRPIQVASHKGDKQSTSVLQTWLEDFYASQFTELKKYYEIVQEEQVFAYLRQHGHLFSMLFEGRTAVAILFGDEVPVSLRIQHDPDVGQDCLIAWIQTDLSATEAVECLMEFNETWLIDRLDIIGERLTFLI